MPNTKKNTRILNTHHHPTYVQQFLVRVLDQFHIVDSNARYAIEHKLGLTDNAVTVHVNHAEGRLDKGLHRLRRTCTSFIKKEKEQEIHILFTGHYGIRGTWTFTCGNSLYFLPMHVFLTACLNSSVEIRPSCVFVNKSNIGSIARAR